jgi:riboflavin kinase/FMN adenylyltransferase
MGTFDGVHRGHRAVLAKAVERGKALGVPALAMTFNRPPRLFFFPQPGAALLTLPDEKASLFHDLGIKRVDVLPFGKALARLTAEDFFDRYVRRRWKAREIVVGYNFGFGRGRRGDPRFLEEKGRAGGLPVHVVPPVTLRGVPVSSESIRTHLRAGELAKANAKLGYDYFVTGKVVRGHGRGRTLGVPTANVDVAEEKIVPRGVFAVRVRLPNGKRRKGMANVGVRPTMAVPDPRPALEVHLFGFQGNLVGKTLEVSFAKKLREERKFPSFQALARQLRRDAAAARSAL